jgi:predicted aspartyl protease
MAEKTFVYQFAKFGDAIYRPFIPIRISNPVDVGSMSVLALLDTGADSCVFPRYIAEFTNHNLMGDGVHSSIT